MDNYLSNFDLDYRNNLFYHNRYHYNYNNKNISKPILLLPRDKFSFNNIHMNLGPVRWYSTRTINYSTDTKQKNLFSRLYIGVKKGIFTPTLPNHIIQLNLIKI